MEKSSFFNSINKDRTYKAEDFAKYFSNFVGNGVFAKHGQALAVTAGEGMQVILGVGSAFINGYAYENTTPLMLDVDVADGVLKRIDRLVLRWSLQDRNIKAVLVKGQAASEPMAVELTRNSEVYELAIADVLVGQGVVEILQTAITDRRQNNELCGYVTHMLLEFNPEGLYAQHSAIFSTFMESVETTLQGDVAGNLLVKINQNKDEIENNKADISTNANSITSLQNALKNVQMRYVNAHGVVSETASENVYLQMQHPVDGVWEWVDIPYIYGIEYRTRERFQQNKIVYCKTIDCGKLPNNTVKAIDYSGANIVDYPVRVNAWIMKHPTWGRPMPIHTLGSDNMYADMDRTYVRIRTHADWSNYSSWARVWYTKVVD